LCTIVGATACLAYDKTIETAKKYGIFDKLKNAGIATATKMSEINEEYKLVDKTKNLGSQAFQKVREIDDRYEITGSAAKAITQGVAAGTKEIFKAASSSSKQSK